jgi:hypothetical protein
MAGVAQYSLLWPGARRVAPGDGADAWRFRTKRHLWAYAGLAVVPWTSAEYEIADDRPVQRRRRWGQTRGLNRNHHPIVKDVFKSAATPAASREGALQDWYNSLRARGLSDDLARVTLARKLAALTFHLWKPGVRYDPTQLSVQAQERDLSGGAAISNIIVPIQSSSVGAEGSLRAFVLPAASVAVEQPEEWVTKVSGRMG